MEAYNLKFDDDLGRPIRAWYYIEPVVGEGQLIILPSPEFGEDDLSRRVVMVTLPVYEAVKLCEEACFDEVLSNYLDGWVVTSFFN